MAETTPLLSEGLHFHAKRRIVPDEYVHRVLTLSLSASVAMAATAATTVYAYAFIMCEDPLHCKDDEKGAYAGSVALATGIANICGILALGPLQEAIKSNAKVGLFFWLVSRGTSVAVLAIAGKFARPISHAATDWPLVIYRSINVAFIGRIFEGFATDNLLHYNLGAVFVSVSEKPRFSRLMGTSLALFMIGMSLSPTIVGFLPSFFTSFIVALCIFAFSALYLALFVPVVEMDTQVDGADRANVTTRGFAVAFTRKALSVLHPLTILWDDKSIVLPGLAMMLHNTAQAYLFPAMMVYASLRFSFTGRENGYLISLAAGVSALYLLAIFYIIPAVRGKTKVKDDTTNGDGHASSNNSTGELDSDKADDSSWPDSIYAILSISTQLVALPCLPFATESWQLFPLVVVISLGLAAPSFIKSYGVSLAEDKPAALATLAMMESIGGLLSVAILGSVQSHLGEAVVFFWASGLLGAAVMAILASVLVQSLRRPQQSDV